jgi:hypothetical protein
VQDFDRRGEPILRSVKKKRRLEVIYMPRKSNKIARIFVTKPRVAKSNGVRPIPCRMAAATIRPLDGFDIVFEAMETAAPTIRTVDMFSSATVQRIELI